MEDTLVPKAVKWPFFLADVVLLLVAGWVLCHLEWPPNVWLVVTCGAMVLAAGWFSILPYLLEYQAAARLAESQNLHHAVSQIQKLEEVAGQITSASSHWQTAHEMAEKTNQAAREITDRMAAEARAFTEFLEKTQEAEKAHMRLENEKLRRSESEWLQLTTGLLDHVFALYQAGVRSGQPNLTQQLGHFQNACRDLVRRAGLVPFAPEIGEPYDAQAHQTMDNQPAPPEGSVVANVIATGYTYQGRPLRKPLVVAQPGAVLEPETPGQAEPAAPEEMTAPTLETARSYSASMPEPTGSEALPLESGTIEPAPQPVAEILPTHEPEPVPEPVSDPSAAVREPAQEPGSETPVVSPEPSVEAAIEPAPIPAPEPSAVAEEITPVLPEPEPQLPGLADEPPEPSPKRVSKPRPPMEQELF